MLNDKYKKDFLHAGSLANVVRSFGKSLIKKGASYNDVISKINHKIFELGARPAFPPQLALNDVAAHYLPKPDEDLIFFDEIIKLDIGVCYNGAIGDCAATIDLSGKFQVLITAAEAALLAAEQSIEVGRKIREIGKIIAETISSYGLKPIKNLGGHGLGLYKVHTPPMIPNYDDKSSGTIKPGMTFAIEPFATNGHGSIYEGGTPCIFSFLADRPVHSEPARELLKKIKTFKGLPFAVHDLIASHLTLGDVKFGLAELLQAQAILGYAPLIEKGHGMVAQAENSVLVDEKGKVFITTRDNQQS
ncbi:MAG TPA: type II methionyl aminopeptidase [Rhabdochlamydiaceae bacterium]|nr:type II methionyl aminopeptidase [Rhabdochlamydiaceae bacterium]